MRIRRVCLLVGVFVILIALCGDAASTSLDVSLGIGTAVVLWQDPPTAFAEVSNWLNVGMSVAFGRLAVGMGISLLDFDTLRIKEEPSLAFSLNVTAVQWGSASLYGHLGLVWNPFHDWIGLAIGAGAAWRPIPLVEVHSGLGMEVTQGSSRTPAGVCVYASVGVSLVLPLL